MSLPCDLSEFCFDEPPTQESVLLPLRNLSGLPRESKRRKQNTSLLLLPLLRSLGLKPRSASLFYITDFLPTYQTR